MRDQVLSIVERYLGRYHPSGEYNVSTVCPFHTVKDGMPFSVNTEFGLFHCFSCGKAGTIVNMLRDLHVSEHIVRSETDGLRQAMQHARVIHKHQKQALWAQGIDPFRAECELSEGVIAHFLYTPDACRKHPTALLEAGFTHDILDFKDVGYDDSLQRIIYPVRDIYGGLAGVSGGANQNQKPKYKVYRGPRVMPDNKKLGSDFGPWFDEKYPDYEFHNHLYLWNYERVYPRAFYGKEVATIIIVEGFKACLWLLQHGYWNTVALMGSKISERQMHLLRRPEARYLLFLDNDKAGLEGTRFAGDKLDKVTPGVHVAHYPDGSEDCQPDDLNEAGLKYAIDWAVAYPHWRQGDRYGTRPTQAGSGLSSSQS